MILVTGGTGLVGHYLIAALLEKGKSIRALYRTDQKRKEAITLMEPLLPQPELIKQIDWFQADLLDLPRLERAFKGIRVVYHCAGRVSFDIRDRKLLRKVNIEGTANMVNLALAHRVEKFCHLSSVATLGQAPNGGKISEDSPRNPNKVYNYYEISKYGGEMEVWRAAQEGLPVVILNPAIIIGAGNWTSGSGQLFDRVYKGFPFRIPRISGYVAVEDVVSAMIQLTESPIKNERFICVATTEKISDLTDEIAAILQVKPPKIRLRKWMVYLLWLAQSVGYAFGGKKQISHANIRLVFDGVDFDHQKLKKYLGFTYTPISEALAKTGTLYLKTHHKS